MTIQEKLAKLEAAGLSATEDPWFTHPCGAGKRIDCWCRVVGTTPDPTREKMDSIIASGSTNAANAEFISLARNEWGGLLESLRLAVEALQKIAEGSNHFHERSVYTDWGAEALETIKKKIGVE